MHNIRKYNWGGAAISSSQQSKYLEAPSSLWSTIQNSSNFLASTLANSGSKIVPDISKMRGLLNPGGLKDLGNVIGGGFNNLLGQGGSNVLNGLKGFTGLNSGQITGIAGDLTGMGLEALGVSKADSNNLSTFDKGLGVAKQVTRFIPGAGWVASAALEGLDLINKYAGKTSAKQGTADMGNIYGYGMADVNESANTKHTFSDTVRGWFGKSKREKTNEKTRAYDRMNLLKSVPGYDQQINLLAASNTSPLIQQKNWQQTLGGVDTRMLAAKKGTKIPPAKFRNIVNKISYTPKLKQGGAINVIPEGAFHSRKNNLPDEIAEHVTHKGIPVVTEEEGGKLQQHAEIEKNEIIFHKEATEKIESWLEAYNDAESQKEKDLIAIECGKYIANEILVNTQDNTGLIDTVQ